MRRFLLFTILFMIAAPLVGVFGYYAHKHKIQPIYDTVTFLESRGAAVARRLGYERQTDQALARIDSTFLELKGTVYRKEENDFSSGGAIGTWGDDLFLLSRIGNVFLLEDGVGLNLLGNVELPDNGLEAYIEAAASEKYSEGYTHAPRYMRYNDLEFIDAGAVRGLATSYTFFDPDRECYGTRVAWLPVGSDVANLGNLTARGADWKVIFETEPCLPLSLEFFAIEGRMAGGRMAFKAPSTLYLGSGEYHLDGIYARDGGAASLDSDYGKVIAIDLSDESHRIISRGHRNIQGITVDPDGRLWITEHGFRGGDELNLIREGADYGWPRVTLGTLYNGQPAPVEGRYGRHELYEPPVYAWLPSAAVSSLTTINGIDESWDGDLLAGSLSNPIRGRSLFHIRIRDERVVFVERIRLERRIRDVRQYGENRIAVWMDGNDLAVFELGLRKDQVAEVRETLAAEFGEELAGRAMTVLASCNECHSYQAGVHEAAPSLNGMVGRGVADTDYEFYSDTLTSLGGIWSRDRLRDFLTNPEAFAPGTSMPESALAGETDDALLDATIRALAELRVLEDEL